MSGHTSKRILELAERAIDMPADARASFLEASCASPDERDAVKALLDRASRESDRLDAGIAPVAAQLLPSLTRSTAPARIGPYRVEGELNAGGMGVVYRAWDPDLHQRVAIKTLPAEYARDADARERLRREARALAALDHENIATVVQLLQQGDEMFLVYRFAPGRSLRELLAGGPLPLRDVIRYGVQVARALGAAHAQGIVHRDLKPENVIVSDTGQVKLIDFGLAKLLETAAEGPTVTRLTRGPMGTPAYMSPEQIGFEEVDERSDVFSFGVLLFELAAGEHPFAAATQAGTVARILREAAPPLEARRPDVPRRLAEIVACCLSKSRADRFVSGVELAREVEAVEQGGWAAGLSRRQGMKWWRFHQGAVATAYALMLVPLWIALHAIAARPLATIAFLVGLGATVIAVSLRLFLWFVSREYRESLVEEYRRVSPVVLATDLLVTGLLVLAALGLALIGEAAAVAIVLFVVGLACVAAFLVIEPATTRAALGREACGRRRTAPARFGSGRLPT